VRSIDSKSSSIEKSEQKIQFGIRKANPTRVAAIVPSKLCRWAGSRRFSTETTKGVDKAITGLEHHVSAFSSRPYTVIFDRDHTVRANFRSQWRRRWVFRPPDSTSPESRRDRGVGVASRDEGSPRSGVARRHIRFGVPLLPLWNRTKAPDFEVKFCGLFVHVRTPRVLSSFSPGPSARFSAGLSCPLTSCGCSRARPEGCAVGR
jgi:hypothetical protein